MRMMRAMAMLVGLLAAPMLEATAQDPISFRTTEGAEFTDSTVTIVTDVCLGALSDTTIYLRQNNRIWNPTSVGDGLAPTCSGSGHAWQIEGTLRLGTNYVVVQVTDQWNTVFRDSVRVIRLGSGSTTVPSVVAPAPSSVRLPPGQSHSLTFTVTNVGITSTTFNVQLQCTLSATSCNVGGQASFTTGSLSPGQAQAFAVNVTPSDSGGTGMVRLIASGSVPDTGSTTLYAARTTLSSLTVTRMADTLQRPASSASVAYFRVANPDAYASRVVNFTACAMGESGCSVAPSSTTIGPMSETVVRVNFNAPSSGVKKIVLTAMPTPAPGVAKDSIYVKEGNTPPVTIVVTAHDAKPRSSVVRGACVSVAVGPGMGVECGELRMGYAFPGLRTMNRERALGMVYLSQHAAPRISIPITVAIKARTDSVNLQTTLVVGGFTLTRTVPWTSACAMASGCALNVPLNADSLNLQTGIYNYTVQVSLAGATPAVTGSVAGTAVVVNRKSSAFGAGWWIEGLETLMRARGDTARLWIGGDGSARLYLPDTGSVYRAEEPTDRGDMLVRVVSGGDTTWVRHLRNGARVTFDRTLRHASTRNREGHLTQFSYDSLSPTKLQAVHLPRPGIDPFRYTFDYDNASGVPRLTRVFTVWGGGYTETRLVADTARRIVRIIEQGNDTVSFEYDSPSWYPKLRRDRMGQAVLMEYGAGYVTRVKTALIQGGQTDTIATRFCAAESRTLTACAIDNTSTAAIATSRFMTRVDGPLTTGGLEDAVQFFIGRFGAVTSVIDPYGNTTRVFRDSASFPLLATKVIDASGVHTEMTYNARGLPIRTRVLNAWSPVSVDSTIFSWDAQWDVVTETRDPTGVVTRFGIDAVSGNRIWQQSGTNDSTRTHIRYDLANRPIKLYVMENGQEISKGTYEYSSVSGNLLRTTSASGQHTRYILNEWGGVREILSSLTEVPFESGGPVLRQRFVFDSARRVVIDSTIAPARGWSINPGVTMALSGTTEPLVGVVTTTYDREGRPLTVTRTTPGANYAAATAVSNFGYDNLGRQRVASTTGSGTDSTTYDRAGNPIRIRTRNGQIVTQSYDLMGRLLVRTTSEVRQSPFLCTECDVGLVNQYDVRIPYFRTVLAPSYSAADMVIPSETAVFGYDQFGRMIQADNPQARIRRAYFPNGALKADSTALRLYASAASDPSFTNTHLTALTYTYDAAGRRLTRSDNWGGTQRYAYDILGQLKQTIDTASASSGGVTVQFGYDRFGHLKTQSVPTTLIAESWTYDDADRPTARTGLMADAMEYDVRGKRTSVSGSLDLTGLNFSMEAAYDAFGHVVATGLLATGVYATDEFFPDAFGNSFKRFGNRGQALVSSESAETQNFLGSRMISTSVITHPDSPTRTGPNGGPPVQAYNDLLLQYDAAGNVRHQSSIRNTWHFNGGWGGYLPATSGHSWSWTFYDANNRPRFIQQHLRGSSPGAPQTTFTEMWYDALGRRVLMRFQSDSTSCYNPAQDSSVVSCQQAVTRFSWDGDQLLREARIPGGWQLSGTSLDVSTHAGNWYGTRRYTQTGAIDTPLLLWLNNASPRYIARNWRGSAAGGILISTGATDGLAYPAARVDIQYASDSRMNPATPNAWLGSLIEEQRDPTGLLYRRNRYYDPATGRFTQEDPIGLAGGANLYGFANGDAVNGSDPFGLKVCFRGRPHEQRRLANHTRWLTDTKFELDEDGCAENVAPQGKRYTAQGTGFAEMVQLPQVIEVLYGTGGSRQDGHQVIIDRWENSLYAIGYLNGSGCVYSDRARHNQRTMLAHELGEMYGLVLANRDAGGSWTWLEWENAAHARRGRGPGRVRDARCHVH